MSLFESQTEKVIIIWSGPAGHSAAVYAARAWLNPLMFEGFMAWGVAAGGQLTTTTDVENYQWFPDGIMGPELMNRMRQHSINAGTRIETKTVDAVDLSKRPYTVKVGDEIYKTHSIIISTGATAKKLDVPGVEKYRMRGISGCAVCDGALPIFRDKLLVVIWGGDVAMEEALYLSKFGRRVIVMMRWTKANMKASKVMQERAFANPKIDFLEHTELLEVWGEKTVTVLKVINNQTQEETEIGAWGLFFAIGHTPNTEFLENQVHMDESGYIITIPGTTNVIDPSSVGTDELKTIPGVYAAGDVQDKIYRQAITSAGSGCMAALDAERWLSAEGIE